jgi:hypothetical protein
MRGASPQFIDRKPESNQRANAGDQRDFVDGLGQEVVSAGFETAHAIGWPVKRGQENDRQMSGVRRGSQPSANLETVHSRHLHVEEDDVASALLADGDRVRAVRRQEHLEIFEAQSRLEQLAVGPDVVDDQHASSHPASPGPRKWSMVSKNLATDIGLER